MIRASNLSETLIILFQVVMNADLIYVMFHLYGPHSYTTLAIGCFMYQGIIRSFYLANTTHFAVEEKGDLDNYCKRCKRQIRCRDHHCVFIGRCVEKANYRFFLSYVGYCYIMSVSLMGTTILNYTDIIGCWRVEQYWYFCCLVFACLISVYFMIMTGSLLTGSLRSIVLGVSTFEQIKKLKPIKYGGTDYLWMIFTSNGRSLLSRQFKANWSRMVGDASIWNVIFVY